MCCYSNFCSDLRIAEHGLSFGGGHGGASILELQSGALSFGDKFVNVYKCANLFFFMVYNLFELDDNAILLVDC